MGVAEEMQVRERLLLPLRGLVGEGCAAQRQEQQQQQQGRGGGGGGKKEERRLIDEDDDDEEKKSNAGITLVGAVAEMVLEKLHHATATAAAAQTSGKKP